MNSDPSDALLSRTPSSACGPLVRAFNASAWAQQLAGNPVTDKVTDHTYDLMYGVMLMPLLHALGGLPAASGTPEMANRPLKLLEIGLGCNMQAHRRYSPGASAMLWRSLLKGRGELWEAEVDEGCVAQSRKRGLLDGIHTLTGDQADRPTLRRWVRESGGQFDVVIDDGGHTNRQILTSFEELWPHVRRGGFYFLEDLHIGRHPSGRSDEPEKAARLGHAQGTPVVADVIQAWIEQLLVHVTSPRHRIVGSAAAYTDWYHEQAHSRGKYNQSSFVDARRRARKHPLPPGVAYITCQAQACVIAKGCGADPAGRDRERDDAPV